MILSIKEQAKNNWGSASDANVTANFYWKTQHIKSFRRFNAGLSAVRNTEWAENWEEASTEVYIRQ